VDSSYSHGAWAEQLGGIELPLLADFNPKGAVARSFGLYLDQAGITDRATVLIDANGVVRHASSVTPAGARTMADLVALCEEVDRDWDTELPAFEHGPGLPPGTELYVKDRCMFSRWARYARANLHLEEQLPVVNVSTDDAARARLEQLGGKHQAPALVCGDQVMYESKDIITFLVEHAGTRW
jgi:hypothetical protein